MPGHPSTQFYLEIAHILFIDTVGYSRLTTKQQRESQDLLNRIVRSTARFQAAEAQGKLIRLPTGDGMALVFTDSLESPIVCALEIRAALRDQNLNLGLRMGIHSGPVTRTTDVNDQCNVAGAGMNMAERVMSCADANHILLSKRAADDLAEYERWRPYLRDLGECEGKHGAKLNVVNFCHPEFGNEEVPARFRARQTRRLRFAPVAPLLRRPARIAAAVVALILVAAAILYLALSRHGEKGTQADAVSPVGAPPVLPRKSVAVLPFENLSEKKSDAIFVVGVQDEILTNLAKVADLKVISRTSTMQYGSGKQRNLRQIGQELAAANILEGTVQRDGERVRVSVQLIDAATDTHLWAESYDRHISDTFALESELAKTIVAQLKARLSPQEKAAIEEPATIDPLAHDLYVEANALITAPLFNVQGTQNLLEAADRLGKAVARDPNYYLAYYKLAYVHDQIYLNGPDQTPARRALAEAAIRSLQRLRPDAPETHLALAHHFYCAYLDYEKAGHELDLARRSLPNEPLLFQLDAFIKRRQGHWEESTRSLLRALELDPRNAYILHQLVVSYQLLRKFDEATKMADRALAILPEDAGLQIARAAFGLHREADSRPMHAAIERILTRDPAAATGIADEWLFLALCERDSIAAAHAIAALTPEGYSNEGILFSREWCEGLLARMRGDLSAERIAFTAARKRIEETLRAQPGEARGLCVAAMIDAALGHKEMAIEEGRRAVELLPLEKEAINGPLAIEYLAVTYAWAGEKDRALEQLRRAASVPSEVTYGQLRLHPFWDSLRGDPRFEEIVASLAPKPEKTTSAR